MNYQVNRCIGCLTPLSFFGKQGRYEYSVCPSCKTIQLNPFPTKELLDQEYQEYYAKVGHYACNFDDAMNANGPFYDHIINILKKTERPKGLVIDFGCGYGGLCEKLRSNKIEYVGFDLSRDEVNIARQRNLNVYYGGIDDIPQHLKPSAMIMNFVFEHLVDHDYFIQKCRELLLPSGLLIIIVPTSPFIVISWGIMKRLGYKSELPKFNEALTPPWHTVIFSSKGLRDLMLRYNIEVVDVMRSPKTRAKGLLGITKVILEVIETVGFGLFNEQFPFMTAQTFVCRIH
jgi:SAM-dependent methyltransferase